MKLMINGKPRKAPDSITVAQLLEQERVEMPHYVSVQVNEEFIRREHFDRAYLSEGDRVDFLYYMGGGQQADGGNLSPEQIERYSRQLILEEVGLHGQKKLLQGSVLVVGVGGLGSPAAYYLAAAGVGHLGLIDFDNVEVNNLQRQILFHTGDVGKGKAQAAAQALSDLNPDSQLTVYPERLNEKTALAVMDNYDFVIDATDGFANKYLVNDACFFAGKPFVHAGILRFEGQALTVFPGQTTCYRCLFPAPPPAGSVPSCAQAGILGVLGGFMGVLQASEAIKYLLGRGELLTDRLFYLDALRMHCHHAHTSRNPACPLCGDQPTITALSEEHLTCSAAETGDVSTDENL